MIRRAVSLASSVVKCVAAIKAVRLRRVSVGLSPDSREDVELSRFFAWWTKCVSFASIDSVVRVSQRGMD